MLQVESHRGYIAASQKLVDSLLRSDKPNWFKVLKIALDACRFDQALELLESSNTAIFSHSFICSFSSFCLMMMMKMYVLQMEVVRLRRAADRTGRRKP